MGARFVIISLTANATIRHPPTTKSAIVSGADPALCTRQKVARHSDHGKIGAHETSLLLKPIRTQTVPAAMRKRPRKSNSCKCCRTVLPRCGCRLSVKNRIAAERPPKGLEQM